MRRSKIRRCESADTHDIREGEWGEKEAEYVHEWVTSVAIALGRSGDH